MTTIASTAHVIDRSDQRRRVWAIFGSSSGNLVEWYDFYAYAFTALYFSPSFFPNVNQTTQLLQTAAVFAIGFLMRPIGGDIFFFLFPKKRPKKSQNIFLLVFWAGAPPPPAVAPPPSHATDAPPSLPLPPLGRGASRGRR